jgi:predicted Rossmann-fold nucleotide-binding protein
MDTLTDRLLPCMGALADAVLAARGHVTGVIPEALVAKEVAHVVGLGCITVPIRTANMEIAAYL